MAFKRTIHAVDTHAGTPMRVVTGGIPHIPGKTAYDKMKWMEANDDGLRKLLLREDGGPSCQGGVATQPGFPP
ncbi:proline racemase family protein [Pelagibacterium halotolerans]|uniref:proline racemase family protein n=1 Tax=Pelagibacterium halotolerans TaxID=531813 RepID=UPI00384B076D